VRKTAREKIRKRGKGKLPLSPRLFFNFSGAVFRAAPQQTERLEEAIIFIAYWQNIG